MFRRVLLTLLIVISWVACATGDGGTKVAVLPDLKSVTGTWQGTLTGDTGAKSPATIQIREDGTYVALFGTSSTEGTVEAKDGQLVFTRQKVGGAAVAHSVGSTAVLSEQADGTQVLTGSGRTTVGPYSYTLTRKK